MPPASFFIFTILNCTNKKKYCLKIAVRSTVDAIHASYKVRGCVTSTESKNKSDKPLVEMYRAGKQ